MRKKKTASNEVSIVKHLLCIAAVLTVLLLAASLLMRWGTRHGERRTVPDFTGMSLAEAQRAAHDVELALIVNDSLFVPAFDGGTVLDQLPKGGVEVKSGRKVYITINSFRQKMVGVPYVAGRSLRQAKNMLESGGLEIARLEYVDDIATNYVLEQYLEGMKIQPDTKVEAEIGTGVTLVVGVQEGSELTDVPGLIGLPLSRAKSRIWEMGLNVGSVEYDAGVGRLERGSARVYWQSEGQGHSLRLGSTVSLKLTTDAAKISERGAAADLELQRYMRERAAREREIDSLRRLGLDAEGNPIAPEGDGDDDDDDGTVSGYDDDDFFM